MKQLDNMKLLKKLNTYYILDNVFTFIIKLYIYILEKKDMYNITNGKNKCYITFKVNCNI